MVKETEIGGDNKSFPSTFMWSEILEAKRKGSPYNRETLNKLVQLYWKPAYMYIKYCWHKSTEEAKDLTQQFFTIFLEKDYLGDAEKSRGKFRTFVIASLKHFLMDHKKMTAAQKRGGNSQSISFEGLDYEPLSQNIDDPVKYFDKEWARTVITRRIKEMKEILLKEGKKTYYETFEHYSLNVPPGSKPSYKDIANKLKIKETDVRNYLTFTRKLLKRLIKDELSEYVENPEGAEEEMNYLLSIRF